MVFEGSADDAFIEFVRLNTSHGLPLTLAERREAAHRILIRTPSHSDRWVAQVCSLSPKTVGRIRQDLAASGGEVGSELNGVTRIGRDGRVRPVDPAAIRRRIAEELERTPDASLRSIARLVGASPQTVRSVARRVRDGDATDTSPASERVAPVELAAFARAVVARRGVPRSRSGTTPRSAPKSTPSSSPRCSTPLPSTATACSSTSTASRSAGSTRWPTRRAAAPSRGASSPTCSSRASGAGPERPSGLSAVVSSRAWRRGRGRRR